MLSLGVARRAFYLDTALWRAGEMFVDIRRDVDYTNAPIQRESLAILQPKPRGNFCMRKTFVCLTLSIIFCVLAIVLSTPYATRAASAQEPDPCLKCLRKVQQRSDKCEAKSGGLTQECADEFNQGIVECYATVCEQ